MLYVHFKKIKMDSFEINKIFAAIIVTVLLVLGINKVSDVIFHVEKPNVEGYKVEVKVVSTSQANEQNQVDISATAGNMAGARDYTLIGRSMATDDLVTGDDATIPSLGN